MTDDVWEASIPRVDLYKWLIEVGAGAQHVRPLHALLLDHNAGVLPIRSFDLCWHHGAQHAQPLHALLLD